jgi:hypothetical protein
MSQQGGEEYDMLKSLESLKKLPVKERFRRAVEMQYRGKKFDMEKLVPVLIEGMDEWKKFDVDKLVESVLPKPKVTEAQEPVEPEPTDDEEDDGNINMVMEDYGGEEVTGTLTEDGSAE